MLHRLLALGGLLAVVPGCSIAPRGSHEEAAPAAAAPAGSADPTTSSPVPAVPTPPADRDGDVLTMVKARRGESPAPIGTCDPAERDRGVFRFGLAHFNDLQARYGDVLGGRSRYAYIAGLLRQLKAAQPTLVLDAGDDYEKGSIADLRSGGETTRQMVQALPIDVRTIGNHDFAYGAASVLRDAWLSGHPVLAANVWHARLPPSQQPFRPYVRIDVGCAKVGVIGLVTKNIGADDRPTSAPFAGVFVHDDRYQEILEREAKAHRSEVDVLVALTHLGHTEDLALARRGGRLVDIIVGGYSENTVKSPVAVVHPDNTRTWVLQAGHFGLGVGRGDVVVTSKGAGVRPKVALENYEVVEVDESLPYAEDVAELARRLVDAITPDAHRPIGSTTAPVRPGRPMAELVHRAAAATWEIDALVIGRDAFSAGLPKGEVTLQRLYDAVLVQRRPAGTSGSSSLWVAELSGAEMTALARSFRPGAKYEWIGPKTKLDPDRRYRLALDKRAVSHPKPLFGAEAKHLRPVFLGEIIDALEPYVRARTAQGLPID